MKFFRVFLIVFAASLFLGGCGLISGGKPVTESGPAVTQTWEGGASSLSVGKLSLQYEGSSPALLLSQQTDAGASRVVVEAPESLLGKLKVSFSGGKLSLSADQDTHLVSEPVRVTFYNYSFTDYSLSEAMRFSVEVPVEASGKTLSVDVSNAASLAFHEPVQVKTVSLHASGAAAIGLASAEEGGAAPRLTCEKLKIVLNSASSAVLPDCLCESSADWLLSGASELSIGGSAPSLIATVGSASTASAYDFTGGDVVVTVSSSSVLEITASGQLGGSVSSASQLNYRGECLFDAQIGSSSTAQKTD